MSAVTTWPPSVEVHGVCGETNKRLALAVRLARRDLQRSLVCQGTTCNDLQLCRGGQSVLQPLTTDRTVTGALSLPVTEEKKDLKAPVESVKKERERRKEEQDNSDLNGLKIALMKEVKHLQELCALEQHGSREEKEEEKERAAERVSLMTRKLYDLQQKVDTMNVVGSGNRQTMRGLGPAQRAATRTLYTFSSSHCNLPKQLLDILSHLCRDQQSTDLLSQARMYSDVLESVREENEHPPLSKRRVKFQAVKKQKKKRNINYYRDNPTNKLLKSKNKPTEGEAEKKPLQRPLAQLNQSPQLSYTPVTPAHSSIPLSSHIHSASPSPSPLPPLPDACSTSAQQMVEVAVQVGEEEGEDETLEREVDESDITSSCCCHCTKYSQSHLVSMATTLKSMEEKENNIVVRWQQGHCQPVITSNQNIEDCREQCRQEVWLDHNNGYLKRAKPEEWKEISRLADMLLDEVLTEVCCELEEASDSIATVLFSHEFCGI